MLVPKVWHFVNNRDLPHILTDLSDTEKLLRAFNSLNGQVTANYVEVKPPRIEWFDLWGIVDSKWMKEATANLFSQR